MSESRVLLAAEVERELRWQVARGDERMGKIATFERAARTVVESVSTSIGAAPDGEG